HYRLTTHLGMAFLLFVALLWTGLTHLRKERGASFKKEGRRAVALIGLIFLTILSGGLMAGLSAGHQYNTFPLMNGQVIPAGLFVKTPWWLNFLENPLTIQFSHRMLAMGTAALVVAFWYQTRKLSLSSTGQKARNSILFAILLQVSLGISTLLSVVWVPLAAAHQAGGVVLISAMTWFCHELWRPGVAQRKTEDNPRSVIGDGRA
ncbi:MAG: COX15/CtaA family protein, partial [Myxococcota bacterium]|nr:COX15/CtaA family protein [Myxococcota bacterium]